MQIANFLNFYLVLLWRLGEHAVYDQVFEDVGRAWTPWVHPLQLPSDIHVGLVELAIGGEVIKCPFLLNVLKDTYDRSCY